MPQVLKQEPPAREIASARKAISEQDKQIASAALNSFQSNLYDQCLQQLSRLLELRPHDARVQANKAAVEYYNSNLFKTDEYFKLVSAAKKQLEFGMVNTGDELDDIDRSFLLYNQAVIHFHTKQYKAAINILERLFKIIEPLGDVLALKVCVLLVEVYLLSFQLEQAHGMITYIENVMLAPKLQINDNDEHTKLLVAMFKPKLHMSSEALFLKSNVECLRQNFQKAIKLLNSAPKPNDVIITGQPLNLMYYNDMAAVHYAMKKYNLSSMYGLKAVEENCNMMKALPPIEKFNHLSGRPLHTLAVNRRTELHYNLGLSLLHSGQPAKAFDCFIESRSSFQCNPRYWLRLAECCIALDKQLSSENEERKSKKSEFVRGVVGTGAHRKVVLSPIVENTKSLKHSGKTSDTQSPTLEFANICLCNAMLLLPSEIILETNMTAYLQHEKVITGEDEKELIKRSPAGRLNIDAPPGKPIQTKEAYSLRGSILCCQSYVSLCLGDYYKSLESAKALQRMSHLTGPKRFLALFYQTESLLKLDRASEAVQQLSPEKIKALAMYEKEVAGLHCAKNFPRNVNDVRNATILNLASVYSMGGEYEKSKQLLKQATAGDTSMRYKGQAVLLSAYCDLKMGKVTSALNLIKRNEVFPSGRLIDRVEARVLVNPPGIGPINPIAPSRPIGLTNFAQGSSLPAGGISYPPPGNLTQSRLPGSGLPGSGPFSSSAFGPTPSSQSFQPIGSSGSPFQRLGLT